jgi:hypothetical protein
MGGRGGGVGRWQCVRVGRWRMDVVAVGGGGGSECMGWGGVSMDSLLLDVAQGMR